jgi:hypothetical protein
LGLIFSGHFNVKDSVKDKFAIINSTLLTLLAIPEFSQHVWSKNRGDKSAIGTMA